MPPTSTNSSNSGFPSAANLFGGMISNAAGSFGSGLGTNLVNGIFSGWQRRQAMALYKRQLAAQKSYQQEMARFNQEIQKNYDTWYADTFNKSWERSQLEAAGLSPALMYGGKSGASPAGMTSAGKGVQSAPMTGPGMLPSGASGAGPSIGSFELQMAQAKMFSAQADYWKNKAHTEESMPDYYDAITKLNNTIKDVEDFLKFKRGNLMDSESGKNNSAAAVNWSLSKLNDLQWSIDNLRYKALTKSYHVRYKGMNGILYDHEIPGYLLEPFQKCAYLAGTIMNNEFLGNTMPERKEQIEADTKAAIASAARDFSSASLAKIELEIQRTVKRFEINRRKANSLHAKYDAEFAKWRNDIAPDQKKFENYIKGAGLVLDALGVAADFGRLGQQGKFYDLQRDKLEERRYEFDHRDAKPIGKTRVYNKSGYTEYNHY